MDITQLGIALDTSDLVRGESALNSAAGAANRAADALDTVSDSAARTGDSLKTVTDAQQRTSTGAAQLASQYSGLSQATAAADGSTQKYLASLKQEYDLLGLNRGETEAYLAKTQGFTQQQQQLAAALGAKIDAWHRDEEASRAAAAAQDRAAASADQFIAKLQAQAQAATMTRAELLQMQAAQLGVSQQAAPLIAQIDKASGSTHSFSLASAGASRELIVLAHELSQGNFSRFGGSMMVMAEQTNALGAIMSPTGLAIGGVVAALALFATAAYQGAQQSAELQKSLVLTGGYAGLTEDSFNQMAEAIAKASNSGILTARNALQDMVSSGKVTGDALQTLGEVTVEWASLSGKKLGEVAQDVDKMPDHVAKWAEEHNQSMHFMSAAELEYVKQLEDTGNKQQAMLTVGNALLKQFSDDGVSHLNLLGRAFHTLSEDMQGFWNVFQQVGRSTTTAQQIAALETKKKTSSLPNWSDAVFSQQNVFSDDDQKQLDALYKKQADDAAAAKAKADEAARQQALGTANNYLTNGSHMTQAEQLKKQIDDEDAAYKAAIAGAQNNQALMEQITDAHYARMEALETKHQKKAKDNTQNFLSGQLTELDGQRKLIEQGLTDHLSNLAKQHSAGRISDQSFLDQEYQSRNDALQKELAIATQEETIAEGKNQLSAAEKYKNDIATIKQKILQNEQDHVDAVKDLDSKASDQYIASLQKQIDAANNQDQGLKDQIATFGMTKSAIDELKASRADDTVAALEQGRAIAIMNNNLADTKPWDDAIAKAKELATALHGMATDQSQADMLSASQKAADQAAADWKKAADNIDQSLTNALMNGFQSGKGFAQSFVTSLEAMFKTLILQPIIAPIAADAASFVTGQSPTNTTSGLGALLQQAQGTASVYGYLQKGYGMASGYFGLGETAGMTSDAASSIGGTLAGGFGSSGMGAGISGEVASSTANIAAAEGVGSSGASTFNAGAGLTGAGSGAYAIPIIGWIMAGMALDSKMMAQGWNPDNGSIQGIGKGIGSASLASYDLAKAVGIPSGIANILTGASTISRLFGRKDPVVTSQGVDGMVTVANGFQGQDYTDWFAKGGLFRSDARGTVNGAATQDQKDMIGATIVGTIGTINQLGDAIGGIDGLQGKLSQFQYSIRNDWSNQTNVTKSLTDLSNSLVDAVIPLDQYQQTGESLTQTAVRLTGVFTSTNQLADILGRTMTQAFGAVGLAGADARLNLVAAAGGITQFNSEVTAYVKAYYSGSEQLSQAQSQMTQSFASLGLALPQSKDAFRAVVSSLDLTTTAGQNTFAALMALAPAFDQMSQAMQQAADAQQALWDNYFKALYTPAEQQAQSVTLLGQQFAALGVAMPKTADDFRKLVENMDTSSPAVKQLQDALLALAPAFGQLTSAATQAQATLDQNVQTALGNVQTAYNTQSQAIQANITSINQFITSLTSLKQSLSLGSLSTLSPQDKYLAEKQLFDQTSASAAAGDATAQGQLPQVAQDFLTASQAYNASSQAYVDDYNAVQSALDKNIATAQQQLSAAQQQLNALNQMVSGILNLNQTAQTVAQALNQYFAAQTAAGQKASGSTGSFGPGLDYTQSGGVVDMGSAGGNTIQSGGGITFTNISNDQLTAIGQQTAAWNTANLTVQQAMAAAGLGGSTYANMGEYSAALFAAENAYGNSGSIADALAAAKGVNGSHAGGADYIPFDGYRAELHKGEAVVTSANNQKLSQMLSIDWSRFGNSDNAALIAEVKALRTEMVQMQQRFVDVGVAQMQQADQHQAASLTVWKGQARHLQTVGDNTGRIANKP